MACYDIEDAEDETGKGGSEMTKFSISLPGIDQDISRLDDEIRKLQRLQQAYRSASCDVQNSLPAGFERYLANAELMNTRLGVSIEKFGSFRNLLEQIRKEYARRDSEIVDIIAGKVKITAEKKTPLEVLGDLVTGKLFTSAESEIFSSDNNKTREEKFDTAFYKAKVSGKWGEKPGVETESSFKKDLEKEDADKDVNTEKKTTREKAKKALFGDKKEKVVSCEKEADLLHGSAQHKGTYGELAASGAVAYASAYGDAGAVLTDEDGKFAPGIYASGGAEVGVAKGEVSGSVGDSYLGLYGEASGSVLSAEAQGTAAAGAIHTDDGKTEVGVSARGEVGAYLAEGKASGGFEVFGVKIGVVATGSVGAGLSGEAEATTSGFKLGGKAVAGIGGGLEVSVDWSDARNNMINSAQKVLNINQ
ncbi:hypothetical protein FYJ60_10165 [Lachnospiraceae bacterium Oil+RF-744-WCA-WT-13]|uniref:LXG domain-containing protein n=2 Tax=Bilifractor porci TaxID=2606636 RepID=A0A7X2P9K0_9FIRM|nr:hypothetical protein [Bilifractor porci]